MLTYRDFLNTVLPGNYALTKSMELTKVSDSGTLWYTKKFLTLYYFIFLSNDIMTLEYKNKVIRIFDNYIDNLPEEIKDKATLYFYPENESINFKSDNFNLFSNFASHNLFLTQDERVDYYQSAKKYYFSLLMGSGGQTGIKKKLKEAVQQPGFVYSHDNIDSIIFKAAIESCKNEANINQRITDNSVKYILSERTMSEACRLANTRLVNDEDIIYLNRKYPKTNPKYRSIENDMIAFIRNERQILYYYGYFHSKSTGATDFEFSSLTPIGELALKANAIEFLIIWEHQKNKMISQPATADINDVPAVSTPPDCFGISYNPYTDILGYLVRQDEMSLDEYKYIVSRKKHSFIETDWEESEDSIADKLPIIKKHINGFGRIRDQKDEDGRKELLKYILGIRSDLRSDAGYNPLGIVSFNNGTVSVDSFDALILLYSVYSRIDDYKLLKYREVFEDSEKDLRRRYKSTVDGIQSAIDGKVKINWDLYNIHPDNFIIACTALVTAALSLEINEIDSMSREDRERVSNYIYNNCNNLFKELGINTLVSIRKMMQRVLFALKNEDYSSFINVEEEHNEQILARYKTERTNDLFEKIKRISSYASISPAENRERNGALVSLMKSYYLRKFSGDGMLTCECCGETTFITNAGEPYIEFHHLIPFNIAYGPDHYLNLFALCPNCHRRIHFLRPEDKTEQYLQLNNNNYLQLLFTERLIELRENNLLRSYHLEFLLADNAISIEDYNIIAA